ncbi:transcription elongation factor SPT5 [Kwoniella sp. DSM 27419]
MSDNEGSSSPVDPRSDDERDEKPATKKRSRVVDPDEEDDVDVDAPTAGTKEDNEDKDDDEDDDEDDEDDEEDEDDEAEGGEERRRKRRRKQKRYRFLDVEAEVDDEDEEEDEDNDYGDVAEFIDEAPDEAVAQSDYQHRRLDRSFGRNEEEDVQDIVQRLKERHARTAAARYNGDSDAVPQRLLMPGVNDPSLWRVIVKTGREAAICASIFRKVFSQQYSANPIEVISVFCRDSLPGMIFLEARQSAAVSAAINGIVGIFASRGVSLVPIEEMAPLLKIKKKDVNLTPGMWVRMKRGKHTGDLAQVVDVDQITSGVVGIKFIPRIDLTPREKRKERTVNGKGLASATKPPARLFSYDDVRKIYGRGSVRSGAQGSYFFDNDEYIDGFCVKDVKIAVVESEGVNPTLEEISRFSGDDQSTAKFDLSAIADANKNLTVSVLFPGDQVEVYEGEQTGLYGTVETVTTDIISIKAVGGDVHGQIIEVPSRSVRKRFDVGEHVKVLAGKNADATGMVVEVKGDVVTLMSDQGEQEVIFSKDIRKAADTTNTTKQGGLYDVHDLVMLDSTTAAVVTKVEGALLRILDQNGASKSVTPDQVTLRRDNKRFAVATDSQGNDMKVGDNMKETEGENRQGEVINIFRSLFVFLHNRELTENHGVFVARAQSLISVTPKSGVNDLGKMNPALNQQLPYGGASLMPPPPTNVNRNRLINTLVVVIKGTSKGLMGTIRDIQGDNARVELKTNNKTLTIALSSLKRKDPKTGTTYPLEAGPTGGFGGRPGAGGYDVNPYSGAPMAGGQTPAYGGGRTPAARFGQTPNPYAAGGIGGKTPNPYASAGAGGRTPAPGWGAGGKTPAYGAAGGKTPGWAGSGGKTPAYGYGDGGRTPGYGGAGVAGGKTPNPYGGGAGAGPSGGRTPAPAGSMYGSGADAGGSRFGNGAMSAPTPYGGPGASAMSAPTPAAPSNPYTAPTPYGAPTPFTAPTPFAAPTPGAALSAPTPGMGGPTPYGAPTPFGAPTPYGGGANGASASAAPGGIAWDWALDFRNVIVEIGPSSRPNTRAPLHFQRGAHDGRRFGYDTIVGESCRCVSLDDPSVVEDIPAEYLKPCHPDTPGQTVVCIGGGTEIVGQQRTTQYENAGSWMMEMEHGDVAALVLDDKDLCRIWKA